VDREVQAVKEARRFRPLICPLEDRTALSLSLSGFLHSVLPFIPQKSSKPAPAHISAAAKSEAAAKAAELHAIAAVHHAQRLARIEAAHVRAAAHSRVVIA
jgi:hypothetical protein